MLLEIISQSIPREVNRAKVTRRQTIWIWLNPPHIQQFSIPTLPNAELMDAKLRRERVPRLDQLNIWHLAWLPTNRLYRQTIHRPRYLRLIKAHLKLEARCFLTPYPQNVSLEVFAEAALVVLGELFADEAMDDGW